MKCHPWCDNASPRWPLWCLPRHPWPTTLHTLRALPMASTCHIAHYHLFNSHISILNFLVTTCDYIVTHCNVSFSAVLCFLLTKILKRNDYLSCVWLVCSSLRLGLCWLVWNVDRWAVKATLMSSRVRCPDSRLLIIMHTANWVNATVIIIYYFVSGKSAVVHGTL